jgi:uncharacterized protein YdaU (DUF1376 family)
MPLYVADYLRDTRRLTAAEHGAYLLLIMEYWTAGSLPDDDGQLSRIVGMSAAEWRKTRPIVQAFFQEGWRHQRIDDEIAKAEAKHERRSEAGKRGGIASANAKQNPSNASSNAQASSSQPQKKDAAVAAPDPEKELFERGRQVLGKQAGGLISKLLTAKQKNIPLARAAIEQASTKSDPREYIGRIVNGSPSAGQPNWLDGIEGVI